MTSASSFGRVITDIDLTLDQQSKDVKAVTARNVIVTRDVTPDPADYAFVEKYNDIVLTDQEQGGRLDRGEH